MKWWIVGLFVAAVLTRAPFIGGHLANWDAVQYALGLVDFDVTRHQPHPPGSILYIALGRVALALTGEANRALAWISVLAGATATVLCYAVSRSIFGRRIGVVATVLYLFSPLTWYYGVVALPYTVEGALVLGAVATLWRGAEMRRMAPALVGAVLLAFAGGVRQTTMLLLLPLWLYATWRAARPDARPDDGRVTRSAVAMWRKLQGVVVGLGVMGLLCLAWAVPLVALSGGLVAYVTASQRLSSLVNQLTSAFRIGLPAVGANVEYAWNVTALGLNLALLTAGVYLLPGVPWPWRLSTSQWWFLALWVGPALLVYSLLHIGQAGYLLFVWPLACCIAATAALSLADEVGRRRPWLAAASAPGIVALLGISSAALFLWAPLLGNGSSGLARSAIRENDRFWDGLEEVAGTYPPGEVAVLTGTLARESFRQATYYLPTLPVYAVGLDRQGVLGVAFQGHRGEHTYARFMAGGAADRELSLPAGTRRLLVLDASTSRLFAPDTLAEMPITAQRTVWLWPREDDGGGTLRRLTFPAALQPE